MRALLSIVLIQAGCVLTLAGAARGQAPPPPKGGELAPVSISFRNDTKLTVVVQGAGKVKGMTRVGQPVLIQAGKTGFENTVPPGPRIITILDYNQPSRPLLRDTFQIPAGRDLQLVIRMLPGSPSRVVLTPDQ